MGPKHDIYLPPDENQCPYKKYGTGAHGRRNEQLIKGIASRNQYFLRALKI
jgi:hypothetical protein